MEEELTGQESPGNAQTREAVRKEIPHRRAPS
jgi:hypothetical protein